jgi:hypothetical protein
MFILNVILKCLKLKRAEQITQGQGVQEKVPEFRLSIKGVIPFAVSTRGQANLLSPRGVGATMTSPLDLLVHPNLALPTSFSPWSDCLQCVSKPHTAPLKTFHTARLVLLHSEQNPICSSFLQALEPSSHLHSCSIWLFQLSHAEHFALY